MSSYFCFVLLHIGPEFGEGNVISFIFFVLICLWICLSSVLRV